VDSLEHLEAEIKKLIVEAVVLEDLAPDDIDPSAPLFGEGLGLDSIDALEIAMALEERYGVVTDDDVELNQERFASVRSIAAFVAENRTK
jgi:acyl carrier protein